MARAIKKELPNCELVLKSDTEHFPYGNRSLDEIYKFTKPLLQGLMAEGCRVIVIACNTVTTNFISQLREELPTPLVGMEPMIKPAADATTTGVIAVCATPRTLSSQRYAWLKQQFAKGTKVIEPDCSDWALMVETNHVNREKIAKIVDEVCDQKADQIVLGCTHYHWIEQLIKDMARNRARVVQPEVAVVAQLKRVLEQLP